MRRLAIEQLQKWKRNSPRKPLIVRGARQVGKTFLIKQFGKTAFKNYHYINFEQETGLNALFDKSLSPQSIIEEIEFFRNEPINPETDLLVFDEIQRCPRALFTAAYFESYNSAYV